MTISNKEKILLNQAIEKLKRLGFIDVNIQTLLEDEVYKSYYINMLKEIAAKKKDWENTIHTLLEKMGETG